VCPYPHSNCNGILKFARWLPLTALMSPPFTASEHRYGSGKGSATPRPLEPSLGVLLVDFFRLYGRALNHVEVGEACGGGGMWG
jgi:hypothetical protein